MELTDFFRNASTSLGVFYPTEYVLASFRSYSVAETAAGVLEADGLSPERVRFIPASEFLDYLDKLESTMTGMVMTTLSRLTHTEAAKNDSDAARAKLGAGFVAVYCPQETDAIRILNLIRGFEPLAFDYYRPGGVESMVSPAVPATAQA